MKCMYTQTRPRFILSSEGVLGGMELEPMLTPREKSPLPKMSPEEDRTRDAVDSEPKHYQLSYSGPLIDFICLNFFWRPLSPCAYSAHGYADQLAASQAGDLLGAVQHPTQKKDRRARRKDTQTHVGQCFRPIFYMQIRSQNANMIC